MGWGDRPYSSGPEGPYRSGGMTIGLPRPTPVVKGLLIANFAVFVLVIITGRDKSPLLYWGFMNVELILHGQIWRLVTYQYLHDVGYIWHILLNMLGIYFLGPPLERHWGGKRFFWFYTAGGTLGSLFYVVLVGVSFLPDGVMVGASGCVLAVLGACAVLFPHFQLILFIFPVPIRFAAVLFTAIYVLNILTRGANAGGDAAHLAGLAFGVLWPLYGQRFWQNYRLLRQHTTFEKKQQARRSEQEEMDRILRKVHEMGVDSLSGREKKFLSEATKRQRDRDRRAGIDNPL
ncbi:MAG: rhomboid family intramembrane serine protease [Phycisphaerales bacterium]|nr:MAG: rhomboid family intramembrane serine protease [Phycisphaerales bacterium]